MKTEILMNSRIRGLRIIHNEFNVSSSAAYETARNNVFICYVYSQNKNLSADCELFTETNNYLIYPLETGQQVHRLSPGQIHKNNFQSERMAQEA